jgi:alpha-beta hydrolase superfamily lysophospholipase
LSADTIRRWPAPGEARGTVLIVHGMGDHSGRHEGLAEALNRAGFDVVAGDLHGHGLTSGPRGHMDRWEDLLSDVDTWWRAAGTPGSNGSPLYLLGESMGGLVALDWALAHPERPRALILAVPVFRVGFEPPAIKLVLAAVANAIAPKYAQKTGVGGAQISRVAAEADAFDNDSLAHQWMSARFYAEFRRAAARLEKTGAELAWPTLLLAAGSDVVVSTPAIRAFAATNPKRIELHEYPGGYHALFHDEPETRDRAIADIVDFLHRQTT